MGTQLSEDQKLAIAARFAAASRGNDASTHAAMSAPGAVTWHNYDEREMTTEQTGKGLTWIHRAVPDLAWTDIAVKATSDGFIWQSVLTGTAPGGALRAHSCVIVTLNDEGLVTRLDEYLDPAQTGVLRG
jgi:uncharacterized protein